MAVQVIRRKKGRKDIIRAAAYCRVSTEFSEQENSLENQIAHYESSIKENPKYEFIKVYHDFGISGYKEKRLGFQEMMEDARADKFDLIITKSITRFARNTDTVLKATRELKELGIGVFFELQNINTLTQAGELLMTVYAAFGQGESDSYREMAIQRFQRKFEADDPEQQLHQSLGYTRKNGEIVLVPEEASGIKKIFEWVKEGYMPTQVLKKANEIGFCNRDGRPLRFTQVYEIVRNVAYKGDYIMQRTYIDEDRKHRVNYGELPSWYVEEDHPAIVSKKLWQAANNEIDRRSEDRLEHLELKPMTEANYPYRHKLFCAKCGWKLTPEKTKSGAQYSFICSGRRRLGADFCSGVTVCQKEIESWDEITDNLYISFDPDKPLAKRYRKVKESTWKKNHKKKEGLAPMVPYDQEHYHYHKRIFCDKCGYPLVRSRKNDGRVEFVCNGLMRYKKAFCSGVRVPQETLDRLPEATGFYLIKEEVKNGKKYHSYTCKEEKPQRKQQSRSNSED